MASTTQFPSPRIPPLPKITSAGQLLPVARKVLREEAPGIKREDKVLILSDSTVDPLVAEAFVRVAREASGHVDVIDLQGYAGMTDAVDLVDNMFSNNWWPGWVWQAIKEADVFLYGAFIKLPHAPDLPISLRGGKPRIVELEWTRDLLASPHWRTYPAEIKKAIDEKAWQLLGRAREIKVSDPEGTDLTMTYTPEDWQRSIKQAQKRHGVDYMPGHLMVPLPVTTVRGTLATSSITFGGPVPRVKLTIEKGQVVRVEGGGKFGDRLRQAFEQYKDVLFPEHPGPGTNWLTTMGICTHPKSSISPRFDKLSGSGRVYAWAFGHFRSGVIHTSIGEAMVGPGRKLIWHVNLCFVTMLADGKKVIERGRLSALDDAEVRKVAKKYGNPDELLREDWIPAVSGVNAP